MKYLKKSVNSFIEDKNTLKKGEPIYPFVNLKVDENGVRTGVFTDKLKISEDTDDVFEQWILDYLKLRNGARDINTNDYNPSIATNYATRQQLKRIKGLQHMDLSNAYSSNHKTLDFSKYFKNLKHFHHINDGVTEIRLPADLIFIFKRPITFLSGCAIEDGKKTKNNYAPGNPRRHRKVALKGVPRYTCLYNKIIYKNNNRTSNAKMLNVFSGNLNGMIDEENIYINADRICQYQNSNVGHFEESETPTINNLIISCKQIDPLAFYKSNIRNIKLTFINDIEIKNNKYITNSCFYRCANLQTVYLYNVRKIQHSAFSHCYNLEKIYIHSNNGVFLSNRCFEDCFNLTDIYFDYAPRFAMGIPVHLEDDELVMGYQIINRPIFIKTHGIFSNSMFYDKNERKTVPNYNYDTDNHMNLSYFVGKIIYQMFRNCFLYHDLNIHIKYKDNIAFQKFKFFIDYINEQEYESIYNNGSDFCHNMASLNKIRTVKINII